MRRTISATAPIRVCDIGGWTDTWFAGHGRVLNLGVSPLVRVRLQVRARTEEQPQVVLHAANYGDRYVVPSETPRHPLLEGAIEEMGVPDDVAVEISLHSDAPAGGSTGTSAAVTVALLGALDALTPGRMTPKEVADRAHRIEVERLGLQSGVQDQLCPAFGGINLIEIADYPRSVVSPVSITDDLWDQLDQRVVLLFLGKNHVSSEVHEKVIAELQDEGPQTPRLEALRAAAAAARDALDAGDLTALGAVMVANTVLQAELHADLVSPDALRAIDVAREHGAVGWKVNGAGGEGGSLTLLGPDSPAARRALIVALQETNPLFRHIPTRLSRHGLRVWDSGP